MQKESHTEVMSSLQALIARETGAALSDAAQEEMAAIVRGNPRAQGAIGESSAVAEREVTILLADLRGFTAVSATQPAGIVVMALNRCLARLSEVVVKHQGVIDKFMGDSIMVLFGAPVAREGDVERALLCAVEMQLAMRDLNLEHMRDRLPQIFLGIGINTGTVMAGRFGSDVYSEYTVIGEEVHLASRIEAFSLRGQVLISEATYQRCWGLVSATAPMQVYVKGQAQPVSLRELVAIPSRKLKVPRQEFRRSHRVDARIPCLCHPMHGQVAGDDAIYGAIWEVGYHGLLVELHQPLALQSELKLEFDLTLVEYAATDVHGRLVTLKAEQDYWLAGLEFISISAECNAKIQMFVQRMVAAR